MKKRTWKRFWIVVGVGVVLGNIVLYNHAYRFTHFIEGVATRTKKPENLSVAEKLNTALFGISIPKPMNKEVPSREYEVFKVQSDEVLEGWHIKVPDAKGTVILFHGYAGYKSMLLPYSDEFNQKGYSTVLIDFRGSGGSSGNTTTIGFKEGKDVKMTLEYVQQHYPSHKIILFGTSMGAAAIMKAVAQYNIQSDKIILECPFGNLLATTRKRFDTMGAPSFPFAELILAYGGAQTGFNAFEHNPTEYAKKIEIPTLLLYGKHDARVSREKTDEIYNNLQGTKKLVVFENSGHEIYLNHDAIKWNQSIDAFLGI